MHSSVIFRVGPWVVPVFVTVQKPRLHSGQVVDAVIDFEVPSITLWMGLQGRRRLQNLWHELWHLKRYHLGIADGDMELDCKLASAFIEDMHTQLEEQGGRAALDDLMPEGMERKQELVCEPVDKADVKQPPPHDSDFQVVDIGDEFPASAVLSIGGTDDLRDTPESRLGGAPSADCATRSCGREFYAGDVYTSHPRWCNSVRGRVVAGEVVDRELYCPSCSLWQRWMEGWDPVFGKPNGVVVALLERSGDEQKISDFVSRLCAQRQASLQLDHVG